MCKKEKEAEEEMASREGRFAEKPRRKVERKGDERR